MSRARPPVLHAWFTVLLCLMISTLVCVDAHIFSLLFDWRTVCEPNFKVCPNNGLAFRDRKHDCEYPPCELVPPGPPPPPPTDRKSLEMSQWLGKIEFVVPVLNMTMIRKGQRVQQQWLEAQQAKNTQILNESQVNTQAAFIDLFVVPKPPSDYVLATALHARRLHLTSLITSTRVAVTPSNTTTSTPSPSTSAPRSSGTGSSDVSVKDPDEPPAEPSNAVSHPPWSHWELYGQIASGVASVESVQTALELLRLKMLTETVVNQSVAVSPTRPLETLVVEAAVESVLEKDSSVMAQLLMQCENATRASSPDSPPTNATVRVFTTDLRRSNGDQLDQSSWNVTRVECRESAGEASSSSSSSGSGSHAGDGVVVLLRNGTVVDDGPSLASECSCWTRSLKAAGVDAGDDGDGENPVDATTWMLCA